MQQPDSEIQKFYKGSNIFITGGTGFLGKILIEKLLRSTEVNTIYLLIREKKGKDLHSRLDELLDDVIFDRLKTEQPKYKHKLVAVSGDVAISGLGLNINDREKVISNTNIVFHVAATVRFDENIKIAYDINVKGVKDIIEISKHMKNLKCVMHVSTAYSYCNMKEIKEEYYDCPVHYDKIGQALEKVSQEEAFNLTPSFIKGWPNTYTFTKALGESLIKESAQNLPVGIFRPAIVVSTYKEPIPGWIDNMYGPTGVCAGVASGLLKTYKCSKTNCAEIVPVDTCVAALIAAAWETGTKTPQEREEKASIYNYVSSLENPLTWEEYIELNTLHGVNYPLTNSLWTLNITITESEFMYTLQKLFYHLLPAIIFDIITFPFKNSMKTPRLLPLYQKIHKYSQIMEYFCMNRWHFDNTNMQQLWKRMNSTDKELFPASITTVHWTKYFKCYVKGIRIFLLKDPLSNLEKAKEKQKLYKLLEKSLSLAFMVVFGGIFYCSLNQITGICRSLF